MMTTDKLKRIHTLLNLLGKMAFKIDYVVDVTAGRESSTKDLTDEEYERLINILQVEVNQKGANSKMSLFDQLKVDKMKRKILSMCHEMNMQLPGTLKLDMHRVDALIVKIGYLKKGFNDYTVSELPMLVTQMTQVLKAYYKKGAA